MGTSSSLSEVAAKLDKVGKALDGRSLRQITQRVGAKSKPVAAMAVSPNTLSHWGRGGRKGGYKVQARYEVLSDHEVALRSTVPPLAGLLEHGSGTTWKAPRRRGSARRKKGSVGTYTRARVPARNAWSKVAGPVAAKAPAYVADEVERVLRGIF
jgi:hypothetical protein